MIQQSDRENRHTEADYQPARTRFSVCRRDVDGRQWGIIEVWPDLASGDLFGGVWILGIYHDLEEQSDDRGF